MNLKNEKCMIIYILRFPSFAFEHKIKYQCSFGISFLNNEIVLHFQQEDVIQQHGHSQETSKSNSPTIFWLTLLESNIEIEWSWGFWASKNWIHNRGWHVSEWHCFRLLLIYIFPCSLLIIEKTIATSKVHVVEYFVPFDFSMAGIIKAYFGQVWVGGCSGWVI